MTRLMPRRSRGETQRPPQAQRLALQAASLLLDYPGPDLAARLPIVRSVAEALPKPAAEPLLRFCRHVETSALEDLQVAYTDTFDLRRRCSLYLTYYTHGDTRQRGMALLRFSHAYRTAGAQFTGDELPDHLAVVCEFAATTDLVVGLRLLSEHRAGLELIRSALAESASPYLDVLDVVRAVLPEPTPRDLEKAVELARTGPPEEEVGLEPFGPPELMGGDPLMKGRR